jgi:hypothetical protein
MARVAFIGLAHQQQDAVDALDQAYRVRLEQARRTVAALDRSVDRIGSFDAQLVEERDPAERDDAEAKQDGRMKPAPQQKSLRTRPGKLARRP